MQLSDLSREQRGLLIKVRAAGDAGYLIANRSACASSLVRKGFATKTLTRRKPMVESRLLRGQLAELRLTDAGREWLNQFEPLP